MFIVYCPCVLSVCFVCLSVCVCLLRQLQLEDDPGLAAIQVWVNRTLTHAAEAKKYGVDGLLGLHWRTVEIAPQVAALHAAHWEAAPTDIGTLLRYATATYGAAAGKLIAPVLLDIDSFVDGPVRTRTLFLLFLLRDFRVCCLRLAALPPCRRLLTPAASTQQHTPSSTVRPCRAAVASRSAARPGTTCAPAPSTAAMMPSATRSRLTSASSTSSARSSRPWWGRAISGASRGCCTRQSTFS